MRGKALVPLVFVIGGCSAQTTFRIEVDEPIVDGQIVLNGTYANLMENPDGAYWAEWAGSDASGQIDVAYPDGGRASCLVGYVTRGMDMQEFTVRDRKCEQVAG